MRRGTIFSNGHSHAVFVFGSIKNYLTDQEINTIFSRYSDEVEIRRFPACGRIVLSYLCNAIR